MSFERAGKALAESLAAYLEEVEAEGYDRTSFVDFVLVELGHVEGDVRGLVDWYCDRARTLLEVEKRVLARLKANNRRGQA